MDIRVGDIVRMKKAHPCGSFEWRITRAGMDIKMVCLGCGREVMMNGVKVEKGIREIRHAEEGTPGDNA